MKIFKMDNQTESITILNNTKVSTSKSLLIFIRKVFIFNP